MSKGIFVFILVVTTALCIFSGCTNHQPVFSPPIGNLEFQTNQSKDITVRALDDDGDRLDFGFRFEGEKRPVSEKTAIFKALPDGYSAMLSWTPIASDAGGGEEEYQGTFMVTDGIDTATETVIITVKLGGAGTGAPVLITPTDHVLDLDRSERIKFNIQVRDADSAEITLRKAEGPGEFQTSAGSKTASYKWQPTQAEIAERPVWTIRVGADDGANPEQFFNITILIRGGQQKCLGTPPQIVHEAITDQRESNPDILVSADVTDKESTIQAVMLYWKMTKEGEDPESTQFTKQAMESSGGNGWKWNLPRPELQEGETATISYYICAVDDDDKENTTGTGCDQRACIPEKGRLSFVVYPPGSEECEDDSFEENNTKEKATVLEFAGNPEDRERESYLGDLNLCPGDEDYYQLTVPANYSVGSMLGFTSANGNLQADILDQDGNVIGAGVNEGDTITLVPEGVFPTNQDMTVYLRVKGESAEVTNRYEVMAFLWIECTPGDLEPNNTPAEAQTVAADTPYADLKTCGFFDWDWYKIELEKGNVVRVILDFDNAQGDLDLAIFDANVLGMEEPSCSDGLDCAKYDQSNAEAKALATQAGTYYIAVIPFGNVQNTYKMEVRVENCGDDEKEWNGQTMAENDLPADAVFLYPDYGAYDLFLCPGDDDWYFTSVSKDQELLIDLTFVNAQGDLDLVLYAAGVVDASNTDEFVIDASMNSTDDFEQIIYKATEDVDVYIRVMGYNNSTNSYQLNLTTSTP